MFFYPGGCNAVCPLCITNFVLFAKDAAHGITDFTQGGVGLDSADNQWEEILGASGTPFQVCQCLLHPGTVASLAQVSQFRYLAIAHCGINAHEVRARFV